MEAINSVCRCLISMDQKTTKRDNQALLYSTSFLVRSYRTFCFHIQKWNGLEPITGNLKKDMTQCVHNFPRSLWFDLAAMWGDFIFIPVAGMQLQSPPNGGACQNILCVNWRYTVIRFVLEDRRQVLSTNPHRNQTHCELICYYFIVLLFQ